MSIPTSPASIVTNPSLVTLAAVKQWLNITDTNSDAVLTSLIAATSRRVISELSRGPTLAFRTVNEVRGGTGTAFMMLKYWPVLAVTALTINGTIYNPQTDIPFGSGYSWEAWEGGDTQGRQRLYCQSVCFDRYFNNINITYTAGYQTADGAVAVASYTTIRPWISDQGVTDALTGVAFTLVTGTPAAGQYTLSSGIYGFSAADIAANRAVVVLYSYLPEDLQQAIIDVIAWHFRNRDRIGIMSKNIGGQETVAFSQKAWGQITEDMIQKYREISPI